MKRRQFLIFSALGIGALAAGEWARRALDEGPSYLVYGELSNFVRLSIEDGSRLVVPSPAYGHSFTQVPWDKSLIVGVEKSGANLCAVSFDQGKTVNAIKAPDGRFFYGHICWNKDGSRFYSTQVDTKSGRGFLVAYDGRNFTVENEFEITAGGTHDLAWMPDGKTLAITTSGVYHRIDVQNRAPASGERVNKSALVFFDTAEKRVVKTWELADESMIVGHLAVEPSGRVFVISTLFADFKGEKTPSGSLYEASLTEPLREWTVPAPVRARMKNELLTVAADYRRNVVMVTNPQGKLLLEFDLTSRELVTAVEYPSNGFVIAKEAVFGLLKGNAKSSRPLHNGSIELFPLHRPDSSHYLLTGRERV
jgi:hypothetical protein